MKYLLVIMFLIDGQDVFVNGFLPRGFEDATSCEKARQMAQEQLEIQASVPFSITCYEKQEVGTPT